MQQVGLRPAIAAVRAVEPRRLPAMARRVPNRVLVGMGHAWVLHRSLIVRGAMVLLTAAGITLIYEGREAIAGWSATATQLLQGQFAEAGFAIEAISISGQTLTAESDIVLALGFNPLTSTLNFDAEAARARIEALPAVKSATVRKVYPGDVVVEVVERQPIARWRVDGVTFLIDDEGNQIANAAPGDAGLPLIVGEGAADDALPMIRALTQHGGLAQGLVALSRIADRRWDMIYESGLRVQLPERGVAQALTRLETYQRDHALMDRDLALVDLRVGDVVALRLNKREEAKEE